VPFHVDSCKADSSQLDTNQVFDSHFGEAAASVDSTVVPKLDSNKEGTVGQYRRMNVRHKLKQSIHNLKTRDDDCSSVM
jgi:hypothetical protein